MEIKKKDNFPYPDLVKSPQKCNHFELVYKTLSLYLCDEHYYADACMLIGVAPVESASQLT